MVHRYARFAMARVTAERLARARAVESTKLRQRPTFTARAPEAKAKEKGKDGAKEKAFRPLKIRRGLSSGRKMHGRR